MSGLGSSANCTLLLSSGSSICERGFAAYGRIHTAERANLKASTVRSVLLFKAYGPKKIEDFKPAEIYDELMGIIAPDDSTGVIKCSQRRNLAAMVKRVVKPAQGGSVYFYQRGGPLLAQLLCSCSGFARICSFFL
jgi:hypothetical protein